MAASDVSINRHAYNGNGSAHSIGRETFAEEIERASRGTIETKVFVAYAIGEAFDKNLLVDAVQTITDDQGNKDTYFLTVTVNVYGARQFTHFRVYDRAGNKLPW